MAVMNGGGARGELVIGMVHTVPALAAAFDAAVAELDPRVRVVHVADPWMLRTAIDSGVDDRVRERVAAHARHLAEVGARAVLVTCSSIGETVAGAARRAGVAVVRVDAAMADEAVEHAARAGGRRGATGRIAVLATLESTLGPTGRLVAAAAAGAGADVVVTSRVVEGAAAARARGDQEVHDAAILAEARSAAEGCDVVVLAQASMAEALAGADIAVPVLTSPSGGVRRVLAAARGPARP